MVCSLEEIMEKTLLNRIKNLMMKMMISCEHATHLIDKEQYTKISFKEKFDLKLHLMTCKFCRLYKVESHIINGAIEQVFKFNEREIKLTDTQKLKMIEKLKLSMDQPEAN